MLDRQIIPLSFAQGLDTKTDQKQVPIGKFEILQNVVFTSLQEMTKRNGYDQLTLSYIDKYGLAGTIANGASIASLTESLIMTDPRSIYTYSSAQDIWYERGIKESLLISNEAINACLYPGLANIDAVTSTEGIRAFTWNDSPAQSGTFLAYISLFDTNTNTPVVSATPQFSYGANGVKYSKLLTNNNLFTLFAYDSSGTIFYNPVDPADLSYVANVSVLVSDADGTGPGFDAVNGATKDVAFMVYKNSAGRPKILKLNTSASTPTVTASAVVDGAITVALGITVAYDSVNDQVWVFYTTSGSVVKLAIYDSNLNVILAPTNTVSGANLNRIAATIVNGSAYFFMDKNFTTPVPPGTNASVQSYIIDNTGFPQFLVEMAQVFIYSKPFLVNKAPQVNVPHIVLGFCGRTGLQPNLFIYRLDIQTDAQTNLRADYEVVGNFAKGIANTAPYTQQALVTVEDTGNNTFHYPAREIVNIDPSSTLTQTGVAVFDVEFDFNIKPQKQSQAGSLHLTGGTLDTYDNNGLYENNFFVYPDGVTATAAASGNLSAGSYQYSAVYSFETASGQIERSTPSIPVTMTAAAGQRGVVVVPELYVTNKRPFIIGSGFKGTNSKIELYRTVANGTIFFKVAETPNDSQFGGNFTFTFSDGLADITIVGNRQLYTTGGEVENTAPPASSLVTSFKNRLILVPSENPLSWWYSKQVVPGSPVEFSDLFVSNIDEKGGPIQGLSAMDDKLIFFKENLIFYVVGDGPAPSGANNDFSYPQIITTDVGCISASSPVLTPMGIIFQSHKGLYLLDRALNTSYIGWPVEIANTEIITSAQVIENTTQVKFTLNGADYFIMYDYFVGQWSTHTPLNGVDSTIYQGNLTYIQDDGTVHIETPGVYSDNGAQIKLKAVTTWIDLAKLQGYQRIRRLLFLGDYGSPHTLTISEAWDYIATPSNTVAISAPVSVTPLQYRYNLKRQKGEALQLTFEETSTDIASFGLSFSGMLFEAGVKRGSNKMPAAKTYG